MKRLVRAAAIAAIAGLMAGCGADSIAARVSGGLVLDDAESGAHYELSVADGALTLTGIGSAGTAAKDVGLVDSATGAGYSVEVAGGTLMLEPGGAGTEKVALEDTVTAKTYELAVTGGTLTLVANDGGGR
jgi:hypothetical protein